MFHYLYEENYTFNTRTEKKVLEFLQKNSNEINQTPLNTKIKDLEFRTKLRRVKMKHFNYKFSERVYSNIESVEKTSAYKRYIIGDNEIKLLTEGKKNTPIRIILDMNFEDFKFFNISKILEETIPNIKKQ